MREFFPIWTPFHKACKQPLLLLLLSTQFVCLKVLLNRNRLSTKTTLSLHCYDWCPTKKLCLAKKYFKHFFWLILALWNWAQVHHLCPPHLPFYSYINLYHRISTFFSISMTHKARVVPRLAPKVTTSCTLKLPMGTDQIMIASQAAPGARLQPWSHPKVINAWNVSLPQMLNLHQG